MLRFLFFLMGKGFSQGFSPGLNLALGVCGVCVCVCVCVFDGWLSSPHLARVRLMRGSGTA